MQNIKSTSIARNEMELEVTREKKIIKERKANQLGCMFKLTYNYVTENVIEEE